MAYEIAHRLQHSEQSYSIFRENVPINHKNTVLENERLLTTGKPQPVLLLDLDLSGSSLVRMTGILKNVEQEPDRLFIDTDLYEYDDKKSVKISLASPSHTMTDSLVFLKTLFLHYNNFKNQHFFMIIDLPPGIEDEHLNLINLLDINSKSDVLFTDVQVN
ncbi:hypothetical protein M153_1529000480, partial [Pseudoloma neurophilia]